MHQNTLFPYKNLKNLPSPQTPPPRRLDSAPLARPRRLRRLGSAPLNFSSNDAPGVNHQDGTASLKNVMQQDRSDVVSSQ